MTHAELRARLSASRDLKRSAPPPAVIVDPPPGARLPFLPAEAAARASRAPVAAAVLVGLVGGPTPGVLLTKRTAHLSAHPGQISFPGGRIDPTDANAEAAALREAHEEIGIDPARIALLGRLRDQLTGTGYRITPILGLLPEDAALAALNLTPSADEVDEVFVLPLTTILDPNAPKRHRTCLRGEWREFWAWPHPDHYIWGATAAILVQLAERLRA